MIHSEPLGEEGECLLGNTHDAYMQELNVVCSRFLSTSALLTPVLAMQAYCKKLMQDEKALV